MKLTLYETVTNSILEALHRGVVPWRKPWHTTASIPINAISSKPYRGVNVKRLEVKWNLSVVELFHKGQRIASHARSLSQRGYLPFAPVKKGSMLATSALPDSFTILILQEPMAPTEANSHRWQELIC